MFAMITMDKVCVMRKFMNVIKSTIVIHSVPIDTSSTKSFY